MILQQIVNVSDNRVVVNLAGSMYVEDSAELREQLLDYITQGYCTFVIEMGNLDYIDSSGLGVLVAINKRALKMGGRMILVGLKGVVKELFELTRLDRVFEIVRGER